METVRNVCESNGTQLEIKVRNWAPARVLLREFLAAHPELGLSFMESTYYHFTRMHAPRLLSLGVLRRPHPRAAYIADVTTFDEAVFDLLSHAGHKQGVQHV